MGCGHEFGCGIDTWPAQELYLCLLAREISKRRSSGANVLLEKSFIGEASAASEATLSSCQLRFVIYVGIVRACNRAWVRVVTFHAKGPGFDSR